MENVTIKNSAHLKRLSAGSKIRLYVDFDVFVDVTYKSAETLLRHAKRKGYNMLAQEAAFGLFYIRLEEI